jgi:hypothetical protein
MSVSLDPNGIRIAEAEATRVGHYGMVPCIAAGNGRICVLLPPRGGT